MIRLLLKAPTNLTFDLLTKEQQAAISSVFASFVIPMIGTVSYGDDTYDTVIPEYIIPAGYDEEGNIVQEKFIVAAKPTTLIGKSIIDAVVHDNFKPEVIASLGLPFEIIASWSWNGVNELQTTLPLDSTFLNYLPEGSELHLPHNWAGWPEVVL